MVPSEPYDLMRHVDATLVQRVLNIPQRQRVVDLHRHRPAGNLGARLEVAEDAPAAHLLEAVETRPEQKPMFL
jgi:hypothetical protein